MIHTPITVNSIGGVHNVFTEIGGNSQIQHQLITPPTLGCRSIRYLPHAQGQNRNVLTVRKSAHVRFGHAAHPPTAAGNSTFAPQNQRAVGLRRLGYSSIIA
jgi:hypothetical protein